ncbi:hypothetical protein MRB53_018544 [Persea americana]|uniref:Uncharacterized protein n=1 Tax=Persea americana TaxID=3435 RepID=A0ACC2M887_PERAE|nr:hypothetical protein MRB53_018544 [Persea americana]
MAISEGVVVFLLQKLDDFFNEHGARLRNAEQDVGDIRSELRSREYFLQKADESIKEPWLKDIREEAYDIEDVLDAFALHLQTHHKHRLNKWAGKQKNRHKAATQIKEIKQRLHGIWERRNRYSGNIGVTYNSFHSHTSEEMEDP